MVSLLKIVNKYVCYLHHSNLYLSMATCTFIYRMDAGAPTYEVLVLSDSMLRFFIQRLLFAHVFAFGGATVGDMIYFVENCVPIRMIQHARLIYIHVGTNNISRGKEDRIVRHMQQLICLLFQMNSHVEIVVGSILPRSFDCVATANTITEVNGNLAEMCHDIDHVHFHRSHRRFCIDGTLRFDHSLLDERGIHLSQLGKTAMLRLVLNVIYLFQQGRLKLRR